MPPVHYRIHGFLLFCEDYYPRIIKQKTPVPTIFPDAHNIPIIALTAYAMQGDREKYLEEGMNDYLAKSVDMKDLEKALSRLAE